MKFHHRFRVQATLPAVHQFHTDPRNLVRMTPPPVRVELEDAPHPPKDGDQMSFLLRLGPMRIPWSAVFSNVTQEGFTDSQLRGPFKRWVHRHSYRLVDSTTTEITDEISAEFGLSLWFPVALGFWLGLPQLFRHRVRVTRAALEEDGT